MDNASVSIQRFAYDVVYYVLWIVEAFLLLRFLLELMGANATNAIVAFIYAAAAVFMGPFAGIFPRAYAGISLLDPSVLVAMVAYALIAYALVALLRLLSRA